MKRQAEHYLKEAFEYLRRRLLRRRLGVTPSEIGKILDDLHTQGIHVIENYWPVDRCIKVVQEIDCAIAGDKLCMHWSDAEESDYRIWESEKLSPNFKDFLNDPLIEMIRQYCSGILDSEKLLLAARLTFKPGNKGSGGGWHRDSPHSLQFKAILYLTDVNDEHGPFQYIRQSHSEWFTIALLRHHLCRANQFRFTSAEINQIENFPRIGISPSSYTASRGTLLLVNTKGIHRGRPIQFGRRYALTQYCFNGERKETFLKKLELVGAERP